MALDARNDQPILEQAFYNALRNWSRQGGGFTGGGNTGSRMGAMTGGSTGSSNSGGSTGSATGAGFLGADKLGRVYEEIKGTVGGVGKSLFDLTGSFLKGGTRVSDVTKSLAVNLETAGFKGSKFASLLGTGADAVDGLVRYVEEGIDVFRELSKSGAGFNNDVIELRVNAANTRMTLQEFGQVVQDGTQFLSGLGGSVTKGAQVFTNFSKAFFDSGAADELRSMGYNNKEINELLLTQITSTKIRDKMSAESLQKEINSAKALATEMDAVAKLTGKSRKEQEAELRKRQEDGQVRAGIELAVQTGGENVRKAFNALSTASQIGGKEFAKMQEEIFAMERPSEEMAEKFGLAGGAAQKLMFEAAAAAKKGDEAEARRLTREAAAAYAQQQNSRTILGIASQGHRAAVEGVASSRALSDAMKRVAQENNLNLENEQDRRKALELADAAIREEQQARSGTTDAVIQLEGRMTDVTAALNNQLVLPLKELVDPELKKFADTLRGFNDSFQTGGARGKMESSIEKLLERVKAGVDQATRREGPTTPFSNDAARQLAQSQRDAIREALKALPQGTKLQPDDAKSTLAINRALGMQEAQRVSQAIEKIAKEQGTTSAKLIETAISKPGGMKDLEQKLAKIPEIASTMSMARVGQTDVERARRDNGGRPLAPENGVDVLSEAAEKMNQIFQRGWNSIKELNINEVSRINVNRMRENLPPNASPGTGTSVDTRADGGPVKKGVPYWVGEEGPELIIPEEKGNVVATDKISEFAKSMSKDVKSGMNNVGIDMNKISKDITTTISSVTGGGETTTRRVQSEDSKAAQKELEAAKEQFQAEKEALREKIKAQLGPGASRGDITKAAMASDEGKAIVKKYDEAYSTLTKRIDDGIKYETERKESAAQETKKVVEKELAMVKTANSKLIEFYEDAAEDKEEAAGTEIKIDQEARNKILQAAELHKDVIGKNIRGMTDEAVQAMLPVGMTLEDIYEDMDGNLQTWANDSATKLKAIIEDEKAFNQAQAEFQNLSKMVPEFITDLSEGADKLQTDFDPGPAMTAAIEAATNLASQKELPKIDLNSLNLPGFTPSVRTATAPLAKKPEDAQQPTDADTARENARMQRQAAANQQTQNAAAPAPKAATLDDVVKGLGLLNSNISRLIEQNAELGRKQIRAVQANSNNVFERA